MISQIRAVIFSIIIIIIILGSILNRRIFYNFLILIVSCILITLCLPSAYSWFEIFISNRLNLDLLIDYQRYYAFHESLVLFIKNPVFGSFGTIYYVSDYLLGGNDTSLFILYFLSGGLILGFSFLIMLFTLVYDLLKLVNVKDGKKVFC
jgi:hypothetical protein